MDNLDLHGYTSWQRSARNRRGVYGDAEPTKPLSKLDSARLKLSKFKLKYGKQERQEDSDSSLSLASEGHLTKTPLNNDKLVLKDHSDAEKTSTGTGGSTNSSGNLTDDSLVVRLKEEKSENESLKRRPSPTNISTESFNLVQQKLRDKSPSETSLSEISENVHSFSSLMKSDDHNNSIHATEKDEVIIPVPGGEIASALAREDAETSVISTVSSISSEMHSGREIIQMASLLASPEEVSESPKLHTRQSGDSPLHINQPAPVVPAIRNNSSATVDSVKSKLENSKETSSASSFDKYPSPDKISTPTLVPGKTEPRERRNAKVQTDTKRSRHVQVNLSWTDTEQYERRSCPVLRASSLPPGLRLTDDPIDESFDIIDVEDAVQVLLKSQVRLTLGLLQREQSLYINSCNAAARLEKEYRQHTLSETRKFIRREKRLRGKSRRDAKLEKEGTAMALLRKQ